MKKNKKKGFSILGFDIGHYRQTEEYIQVIDAIYGMAVNDFSKLGSSLKIDPDKPFSFSDFPSAKSAAAKILNTFSERITKTITKGSRDQWLYACKKNDEFLNHILNTSQVPQKTLAKFQDRNLDALEAFQRRKVDGMNLSQRIWNYTEQFKTQMELGLDIGIGDGRSAQALSRDLRDFLVDPDKLFRRVRDKHGNLTLSKAAKAYNPGRGKYRSSYKNAMRLTRSEVNMAYRMSDHLRWQKFDFVVGFEIKTSNKHDQFLKEWRKNNPGKTEICDLLKGRYPKTFVFKGWHPHCMCYAVPILMAREEFNTDELNELKAAIKGTEYQKFQSKNRVTDVPDGFKQWMADNEDLSAGWTSQPYFVRDNFEGGTIAGGLKIVTKQPKPVKTEAQKADIQKKWNARLVNRKTTKSEFDINLDSVADKIGITRGPDMSFDDANELRGNISYNKGVQYRVNCQSCVVANELRRRGLDVTAQPNTQKTGNVPYELSKKTEMAWIDPILGQMPQKQIVGRNKTILDMSRELSLVIQQEGRYHIDFVWKGTRSGHIITLEKLSNGKVRFYDPQNGKLVSWNDLSKRISPTFGISILRVDNLHVNINIIDGIVTKS